MCRKSCRCGIWNRERRGMKTIYYELMLILRRDDAQEDTFENELEIANMAIERKIDTESMNVGNAISIIRWLRRNDESTKGKYTVKRK